VEDEINPDSRAMVVKTSSNITYTKDGTGYENASVDAKGFSLVVYKLSNTLDVCAFN